MSLRILEVPGVQWLMPAALLLMSAASAEAVVTTFDTDREGWQITGDNASAWVASGGNPGGCFYVDDLAVGNFNYAVAPPAFLGDWSGMTTADSVSFDVRFINTSGGPLDTGDYTFRISGPGGTALALVGFSPPQGFWTRVSHPLDPAQWTIVAGTWADILEQVDTFMLGVEYVHGEEDVRLDNIEVTGPVSAVAVPCVQETFSAAGTGDWTFQGTGGVSNPGSDGNSGGYCRVANGAGTAYALAPSRFLGDWSALDVTGRLTIDLRLFSVTGAIGGNAEFIRLSGPGGVAHVALAPSEFPLGRRVWKTHSYSLDAGSWTVTSGTWAGLLAEVTECRIGLEWAAGAEDVGFDNFGRLQAGCPPLDQPVTLWVTDTGYCGFQGFSGITSVALNPVNEELYGVLDLVSGSGGGLYRASGDSVGLLVQSYAEPDHLIFDAGGNAFVTEDESGLVHRYAAGGGTATWVSGFHSGDDDPIGLCIAPPGFNGPNVIEGDILVTDWGFNGPDEIWAFSAAAPENERLVMPDPGATDVDIFDLAAGPGGVVYLVDALDPDNLFTLSPTGTLAATPLATPLTEMVSLAYDGPTGALYVVERGQDALHRIDPADGSVQLIADGFALVGRCGLEIDVPNRRLWVTDTGASRIYEFCLPAASGIPDAGTPDAAGPIAPAPRAHPSPFQTTTTIEFTLAGNGPAVVDVFDPAGRRIRRLSDRERTAGPHRLTWDGRDDAGVKAPGGIYFVRLLSDGVARTVRVVLSR